MPRVAPVVPEQSALLCEKCGYIVDGIPPDSLCPECASPIAESLPQARRPSLWERSPRPSFIAFWKTTAQLIFKPTRFFRSLTPRGDMRRSRLFARLHFLITCTLFGGAAFIHGNWAWPSSPRNLELVYSGWPEVIIFNGLGVIVLSLLAYALLALTTSIASRLTAWEATYRGLRLPRPVVQRALHYHAAHYLPVALLTFLTVWGHKILIYKYPNLELHGDRYLYILCAEVILAAGYLFSTYWTGMRNLMYANG
jgi:hypothetical protein